MPIEFKTGKEAIISLAGGTGAPSVGVSLTYGIKKTGEVDYENVTNIETFSWNEWLNLPIRSYDYSIQTVNRLVRIPTVIIHKNFNKNVLRRKRFTKISVLERDNWICQYTGKKLTRKTASIDHVIPRSKGGKTSWDNCVASHISVNNKKGDRSNAEAGLKLMRVPVEPKGTFIHDTILNKNVVRIQDWNYFLQAFKHYEKQD
jgi:5-methylcytosine-specific restriction endonuclease McrA